MTALSYEGRHVLGLPFEQARWVPDVLNVRPCGCDLDFRIFGHRTCRPHRGPLHACLCVLCGCSCHRKDAP
jgi:hypothetical protein